MLNTHYTSSWQALPNPFLAIDREMLIGHISGRSSDITEIIIGGQSAIILTGALHIGKSELVNYLKRTPDEWSWRDELPFLKEQLNLDAIRFVQVDLTPLEEEREELQVTFIKQCAFALQSAYHLQESSFPPTIKGIRDLLRSLKEGASDARCFVILDNIERLGSQGLSSSLQQSREQTPQDQGLALLEQCNAIHILVDLLDEFRHFGVILSIESLPRPSIKDQYIHLSKYISKVFARFRTMTLQIFTWKDATKFLSQAPENFGSTWAARFKALGGYSIFSEQEQAWLLEQAGTHPYLLQQSRLHAFHLKQLYASAYGTWSDFQERSKRQLVEKINESVSTFLDHVWKRLDEAVSRSSQETQEEFYRFLLARDVHANKAIDTTTWNQLSSELRYILYNEGILRSDYDPSESIRYPGAILLDYLIHKAQTSQPRPATITLSSVPTVQPEGHWLRISCSDKLHERLPLSEQEYLLFETLLQHPQSCTVQVLMERVWGKEIKRETFTQGIHRLRQKLKKYCGETEIIENIYGGKYSLNHPAWFQLE
ncbi:MAG TPA: helix-turn-helix domain-containing protein [Ktedonobacteraceae bacterium]|nr:helix-turn-helix domain-containing protein [Ktedonobacteraceae bacterium]